MTGFSLIFSAISILLTWHSICSCCFCREAVLAGNFIFFNILSSPFKHKLSQQVWFPYFHFASIIGEICFTDSIFKFFVIFLKNNFALLFCDSPHFHTYNLIESITLKGKSVKHRIFIFQQLNNSNISRSFCIFLSV